MLNFPLAGCGGDIRNDRHGFIECHSTLCSLGVCFEAWGELYDHSVDPDEIHNRWDDEAYAPVKSKLLEHLAQEMLTNVDQSPHARRRA